jgi:hypothetical protein
VDIKRVWVWVVQGASAWGFFSLPYKYFMSVSSTSEPPSDWYMRLRIGDISDCLID